MKVIIAGNRSITDYNVVKKAIEDSGWKDEISLVISGGARGVDTLGEIWATEEGVAWERHLPEYTMYYGKSAPIARNRKMAERADALILVWDGKSRGSKNMLEDAQELGLQVYEVIYV